MATNSPCDGTITLIAPLLTDFPTIIMITGDISFQAAAEAHLRRSLNCSINIQHSWGETGGGVMHERGSCTTMSGRFGAKAASEAIEAFLAM